MGMDVFGKNPVLDAGEHFRNNVWWWRPLAQYIVETAPTTITSKCRYWQSNDGDGLDAEDARKLAQFLREEIANGNCEKWHVAREERLLNLPLKACQWCNGTGTRTDEVGKHYGMDSKHWCNGCGGTGTKPHEETDYRFSVANVEEFAEFLECSGGFKIL